MSEEVPNNLKQRFKGVENFLRRIAFNLGNSPSQTEVKIISCIPIDVTDLQQKICDLERVVTKLHKPPAIVHTALCEPAICESAESPSLQEKALPESTACENILKEVKYLDEQKTLTFKVSKHLPVQKNINIDKDEKNLRANHISSSLITFLNGSCEKNNKNNFFKKSRKKQEKRNSKPKSHMVFYAQTDNSPFKIRTSKNKQVQKKTTNVLEKKLEKINVKKAITAPSNFNLSDIVRKQYEPLMHQLSGESDFSSPICRDIEYSSSIADKRSDICSCCYKDFLNIDKGKVSQHFGFSPTFQDQINSQNMYYDSSLYDLVPVKEAPVKVKKNLEMPKTKKYYRNEIDFSNYIDSHTDRPFDRTVFVNYHTMVPTPRVLAQTKPRTILRPAHKTYRMKPLNRRMDIYNQANESTQDDTSNTCRVECGDVYKKTICKKPKPPKKIEMKKHTVTNAETTTFNNTECQTVTTIQNVENNSTPSDDKTEETLNQIKSILQSVLTEVKTNGKLKPAPEEKIKRDAVVQKGASFGIIPGSSRLLNSFSYGSYNAGPYGPSCSHPINSGHHWPGMPYSPKCMHNFPVFIQTPGRMPYGAFYKQASHVSKPTHQPTRKATSAATNTTSREERKHETDTLIKEIYKSIALNLDVPKKDISTSNCSRTWRQSSRTSTKSSYRADKAARQCFAELQPVYGRRTSNTVPLSQLPSSSQSNKRRDTKTSVPLTPFSSNTFSNTMTSNTVSVQSRGLGSTKTIHRMKTNKFGHYLDTTQETPSEDEIKVNETTKRVMRAERKPPTTTTGVTTTTLSDESDDSEQTQYDAEEKVQKKKGLFSKMIQSVKLFKNRKKSQKSKISSEEDDESDSDDYQTIYSQQVRQFRRPPIVLHVPPRKVPHCKVSYSRHTRGRNQEKLRRSPMEQEYRRQWNEQLLYQQRPPRHSTDQSERSYRGSQRNKNMPYNQPFVRKPVMVEQGVPVQTTMFKDILTTMSKRSPPTRAPPPQRLGPGPPKGLSWFQKRIRCGENIVRTLIEDN